MRDADERLMLHEEVMLLALRDDEGTVVSGTMYQYALAGAAMAELLLAGRVELEHSGKKKLVRVSDRSGLGAPLIDECLEQIATSKKRKSIEDWIGKFAGIKRLKHRVAERLVGRGILREEEGKVLLVFSRRTYPETDSRPEQEITQRLQRAIFTDTEVVDERTAILLSLCHSSGLLKKTFDRKRLKERAPRIDQIVSGEVAGEAASAAIAAVQAAMMVAVIVPTVISN